MLKVNFTQKLHLLM